MTSGTWPCWSDVIDLRAVISSNIAATHVNVSSSSSGNRRSWRPSDVRLSTVAADNFKSSATARSYYITIKGLHIPRKISHGQVCDALNRQGLGLNPIEVAYHPRGVPRCWFSRLKSNLKSTTNEHVYFIVLIIDKWSTGVNVQDRTMEHALSISITEIYCNFALFKLKWCRWKR